MQLTGVDDGNGGRGGPVSGKAADGDRLKHSDKPWNDAATVAQSLATSMGSAKTELSAGNNGVAKGADGLASIAVLKGVLTSWDERLESARAECQSLAPKLRQASGTQGGADTDVRNKVDSVQAPATDGKGR
ncbi:hypothetical protein ACIQM4_21235 [Streptomyces sp. NPDC091272]|uniref:hypothetical protein n=1 Tax=Streptomyces sp. NPDC091272 TaxID=3365981 RepID=UPI0038159964